MFRLGVACGEFVAQARALGAGLVRVNLHRPDRTATDALLQRLDEAGDVEAWITLDADAGDYPRFVEDCQGRIRYFQCSGDPAAADYPGRLHAMHRAVHAADEHAAVVLGVHPPGALDLDAARDDFDVFEVHLYGPPERVPNDIARARELMRRHGCERPIVVGEQAGPTVLEFPEPERRQMLMAGCGCMLAARRDRIACRQLVVRTALALTSGVERVAYWSLAPQMPGHHDELGRLPLLDFDGNGELTRHCAAADTFHLLAKELDGATTFERRDGGIRVERPERGPLWIVWVEGDAFDGEDDEPVEVTLPWDSATAAAIDAFGAPAPVHCAGDAIRVAASVTPVFVS